MSDPGCLDAHSMRTDSQYGHARIEEVHAMISTAGGIHTVSSHSEQAILQSQQTLPPCVYSRRVWKQD